MIYFFSFYKFGCLMVGMILILAGCRQLEKKVSSESGKMKARTKGFSLLLTNGSPGLYLILAGSIAIIFTIKTGFEFHETIQHPHTDLHTADTPPIDSIQLSKDSFTIKKL